MPLGDTKHRVLYEKKFNENKNKAINLALLKTKEIPKSRYTKITKYQSN